jgi:hypothetical protein
MSAAVGAGAAQAAIQQAIKAPPIWALFSIASQVRRFLSHQG